MAELQLEVHDLTVHYGQVAAVRDLDLTAADGEVVAVLGPSGCGKSTLLRAIAGLERPTAGKIVLDGRDVTGLRPDQRRIGLMFQDHALFPHRTVRENVGFGPRVQGLPARQVRERVDRLLRLVRLHELADRSATSLSGGEEQRVALARALATEPALLMLDEPLGSLDRALGDELLAELARIVASVGTTVLHVTHDQDEALAVADRVVVMRAGAIVQQGSPDELWRSPRTEFVARFLGLDQVLDAEVRDGTATTVLGRLPVPGVADSRARLVVLPDAIRLVDDASGAGAARAEAGAGAATDPAGTGVRDEAVRFDAEVVGRRFAGDHVRLHVRARGVALSVPVWHGTGPLVDQRVTIELDPAGVRAVAADADDEPAWPAHGSDPDR
jgi:thiamine transport system ATP-binding protein